MGFSNSLRNPSERLGASVEDSKGQSPNSAVTQQRDSSIMATNDSSIVSKRAVESLYLPEPHFFRYFVKKKKTRAPLISRGYWLRMRAIEYAVRQFLALETTRRKIIINLGAGYDALPFQILTRYRSLCEHAIFVDVDYPELMQKKCAIIRDTPNVNKELENLEILESPADGFLLTSDHYVAAAYDLNEPYTFFEDLKRKYDRETSIFLFVAEVSICYMDVDKSDNVISMSATVGDARFCLLEQFKPRQGHYPFTDTMLAHFRKVKSPLQHIDKYGSLQQQKSRFKSAGWTSVGAKSLWQLWADSNFLSVQERMNLDTVEPFDEWEDFALFTSHYFLLIATTSDAQFLPYLNREDFENLENQSAATKIIGDESITLNEESGINAFATRYSITSVYEGSDHGLMDGKASARKYGAAFIDQGSIYSVHGGYVDGGKDAGRSRTSLSICGRSEILPKISRPPKDAGPVMCHTITQVGLSDDQHDYLLVGGRKSPSLPTASCWLRTGGEWRQTSDLPLPLYRHATSTIRLPEFGVGVLLFGGRSTQNETSNRWFYWFSSTGWMEIEGDVPALTPRFAASLSTDTNSGHSGLLSGGLSKDGTVISETYRWIILESKTGLKLSLSRVTYPGIQCFERFGACILSSAEGYYLVGGISCNGIPQIQHEIARCVLDINSQSRWNGLVYDGTLNENMILIGHHAFYDEGLVIIGGGAVCFSFGSYNNTSIYRVAEAPGKNQSRSFTLLQDEAEMKAEKRVDVPRKLQQNRRFTKKFAPAFKIICSVEINEQETFQQLVQSATASPFVTASSLLGPCTEKWTDQYLLSQLGADRSLIVHKSSANHMLFRSESRNFTYVTCSLQEFLGSIEKGGREYFRALSGDKQETPANFFEDFKEIAADFALPPELSFAQERMHSSVLRISGPVAMWLHYDVMANVLCQIRGSKTLLLFPPSDVRHLAVPPGASSSDLDVFAPGAFAKEPLVNTHPYKVELLPGQILFIPPLWLHAAEPNEGTSIAVNVFFRDLDAGYAAGRDTYGNRDLQAYEEGRRDIKRMVQRFRNMPRTMAQFYLQRLEQEIGGLAEAGL